ncbi:hypothetical protein COCNU_05G008350 [Cocos nucifera]|uniref:Polygalacturonase n=1 Tax=Cocos nucifera TaxID=13894 RepID=A0A8K0I9W9_COCNU|nr:hypothetical protein COCNU_05G008350 [Cocos nucifera]
MVDMYSPSGRFHFNHQRRRVARTLWSHKILLAVLWVSLLACIFIWQRSAVNVLRIHWQEQLPPRQWSPMLRPVVFNLTDFGGVGDGVTLNTLAFERAVEAISKFSKRGGGQLNVQRGVWLTAPFNLTSHMTLFLAEGAVILGIEDEKYWPLMPPLPSYGYGREKKGPRYGSLIHGQYLKDVVITGFGFGQIQVYLTCLHPLSSTFDTPHISHPHSSQKEKSRKGGRKGKPHITKNLPTCNFLLFNLRRERFRRRELMFTATYLCYCCLG